MKHLSPGDSSLSSGIKYFENIVMGYFYMRGKEEVKKSGIESDPFKYIETMDEKMKRKFFPTMRRFAMGMKNHH